MAKTPIKIKQKKIEQCFYRYTMVGAEGNPTVSQFCEMLKSKEKMFSKKGWKKIEVRLYNRTIEGTGEQKAVIELWGEILETPSEAKFRVIAYNTRRYMEFRRYQGENEYWNSREGLAEIKEIKRTIRDV